MKMQVLNVVLVSKTYLKSKLDLPNRTIHWL